MQEELFEVIDEKGNVVGLEPRSVVHKKGLRHRGIYLLVFDKSGKLFVQQRAKNKDLMPTKWDFSVAGHLQPGESFENAAVREASEELGIKVLNIKLLGQVDFHFKYPNGNIDNESNNLFAAEFYGKIKLQKSEVLRGKFIEPSELLKEMKQEPEKFTPWFLACRKQLEKIVK